jgi:hypothetical protein
MRGAKAHKSYQLRKNYMVFQLCKSFIETAYLAFYQRVVEQPKFGLTHALVQATRKSPPGLRWLKKGSGKSEAGEKEWGTDENFKWIVDCSGHSTRGRDGLREQELR